jgi:hypothetical protein
MCDETRGNARIWVGRDVAACFELSEDICFFEGHVPASRVMRTGAQARTRGHASPALRRIFATTRSNMFGLRSTRRISIGFGTCSSAISVSWVDETRSRLSVPVDAMATMGARARITALFANQAAANPSSSHACPVKIAGSELTLRPARFWLR